MTDPPIQQRDSAVTIQGAPMLASVYRAMLLGIRQRRHDGLPAHDLQALARALFRAHTVAVSPPRRELAVSTPPATQSNGRDGEFLGSAAAAALLGQTQRSIQRLAAANPALLGARRHGSIWLFERTAIQALAAQRKAAK